MRPFILAIGLLAVAQAGTASSQVTPDRPTITVDGYGEVKTQPGLAVIKYTVRGEGRTSDAAVSAMASMASTIETSIRAIDPGITPYTGKVEVKAAKGDACEERTYGGTAQLSSGKCRSSATLRHNRRQ